MSVQHGLDSTFLAHAVSDLSRHLLLDYFRSFRSLCSNCRGSSHRFGAEKESAYGFQPLARRGRAINYSRGPEI